MEIRKEDLPATIQAFELQDGNEIFVAEQVVNSQAEIETFTSLYAGKLIKAKTVATTTTTKNYSTSAATNTKPRSSSSGVIMFIVVLLLVALIIYGFSTGWIQEKLKLKI